MRGTGAIARTRRDDTASFVRWLLVTGGTVIAAVAVAHAQDTTSSGGQSAPQQIVPNADHAEREKGVIPAPTGIDPGIRARPPSGSTGTMPIIRPPGTPGGNPNVVPK